MLFKRWAIEHFAVELFMKPLYIADNLVEAERRKELLDQMQIPCVIKNQRSSMLGGEVPFVEVFPELWVLNEEQYKQAKAILHDWDQAKPENTTGWTCPGCGELHQQEFTSCWQCGQDRGGR